MICIGCRKGFHDGCRGGTWCDCQHRVGVKSAWHEVKSEEELTALLQEMEATEGGVYEEP